jgi:hypothetical protein
MTEKRKRGGQPSNKNAVGNKGGGAPLGNKNARKHGFNERGGLLEQFNYEQRDFKRRLRRVKEAHAAEMKLRRNPLLLIDGFSEDA